MLKTQSEIMQGLFYFLHVNVCVWCVCMFMCVCVHMYAHMLICLQAREWYQLSSSVTFHLSCWDRVSPWSWGALMWLDKLPHKSVWLCPTPQHWGYRHVSKSIIFMWVLEVWTQVPILATEPRSRAYILTSHSGIILYLYILSSSSKQSVLAGHGDTCF